MVARLRRPGASDVVVQPAAIKAEARMNAEIVIWEDGFFMGKTFDGWPLDYRVAPGKTIRIPRTEWCPTGNPPLKRIPPQNLRLFLVANTR